MIWLLIGLCMLVSFLFSGIEAGILSVNRVRLRHRLNQGDPAAIKLDRLLAQPERLLITVLMVTNLMNIFAIVLITRQIVSLLGGAAGYPAAFLLCLPLYLFVFELLPKSLFRRFPYRSLAALSEWLRVADHLLSPLLWLGTGAARLLFPNHPLRKQKLFAAREDFKYLTTESERVGALGKVEREMIHNVVDFRAVTAKEVMTPIASVKVTAPDCPIAELLRLSHETQFERLPVVSPENKMVGLVNVFEVLLDGRTSGDISPYIRRIVNVAPNEPAYSVIRKLRAARIKLACVREDDGHPIGIVSSEDLIRRLVSAADPRSAAAKGGPAGDNQ